MTQTYKFVAGGGADLEQALDPALFKALSDPNRITLVARLGGLGRPATVTEAAGCCPIDLSVVSRHLGVLREAGILTAEKRGREVHYSLPPGELSRTLREIADRIDACCPPECCEDPNEAGDSP